MAENTVSTANRVKLVLAWAFVGIPLLWGISNTLLDASKLFH